MDPINRKLGANPSPAYPAMRDAGNPFAELGEKPVGKLLLQYAIPAIIAMAASSIYNIIDGIYIGQGVGADAITGLALTSPLMALMAAFGAMVGVGGSTLMSVRLGQRDYDSAKSILGNVVILTLTLGIVLGFGTMLVLDPVLRFFGASDRTLPYAHEFMMVILTGNAITHTYLGLNGMLRSTNRPRQAMYATIGTVVLNIVIAPVFIFLLGWGIRGAALATVLSQLIMLCWQFHLLSDKNEMIHFSRSIFHVRRNIIFNSLLIGLPQFLVNCCACLVSIITTRSMAELGGDTSVGAFGIVNRLQMFVVMVVLGVNQGMQPIAGYNFGARKYDRLLGVLIHATLFATTITCGGFVAGMFFPHELCHLFASDSPELIDAAARGLRIVVIFFPIVGMQIVSTAFFQSIGYAGKSIFLSLTRQLLFLIPSLLLLPSLFMHWRQDGVLGVWCAIPVADFFACIFSFVLLVAEVRKLKRQTALAH